MNLSIIVVTRNDDYGQYQNERFRLFLRSLIDGQRYLNIELVIVEWNPPDNRPSLSEQYKDLLEKIDTSIIKVPMTIHSQFSNPLNLPLFEYVGKNVGVRHAKYNWILITNPDIYFPINIWKSIINVDKYYDINQKVYWRATRADVNKKVIGEFNIDQILYHHGTIERKLMANILCINTCTGLITVAEDFIIKNIETISDFFDNMIIESIMTYREMKQSNKNLVFNNACGDFLLISKNNFDLVSGFCEKTETYSHWDTELLERLLHLGFKEGIFIDMIYHIDHFRHIDNMKWHDITAEDEYRDPNDTNPNWGKYVEI